jgi:hypothetical protein
LQVLITDDAQSCVLVEVLEVVSRSYEIASVVVDDPSAKRVSLFEDGLKIDHVSSRETAHRTKEVYSELVW